MGYSTDYAGEIKIEPPCNPEKVAWLNEYFEQRHEDTDGRGGGKWPGIWCDLIISEDGDTLEWNGNEKSYEIPRWIAYLIKTRFAPDGHTLNGVLSAQGEEPSDMYLVRVVDNVVKVEDLAPAPTGSVSIIS